MTGNLSYSFLVEIHWADVEDSGRFPFVQEKIGALAREFIRLGEYYVAQELFGFFSQDSSPMLLAEARRKGADTLIDDKYYDLRTVIVDSGEPEEIDQVLAIERGRFMREHGQIVKVFDCIVDLMDRYQEVCSLPVSREGNYLIPTAVRQIHEQRYDLVVGILGAGSTIPNYLHPLGQNVAYIEWHKEWDSAPIWRSAVELRRGMKILLCENDAVSGVTLKQVSCLLETQVPDSLDVCFTGMDYEQSRRVAQAIGRFTRIFHLAEVDQTTVFTDMVRYRGLLAKALKGKIN